MDETWNPDHIKQVLNSSLERLDQATLIRLRAARMRALDHYKAGNAYRPLLARAGKHALWNTPAHPRRIYRWIGAAVLVASLVSGISYWQQAMDDDTADADIAILTDDLPIQYYMD